MQHILLINLTAIQLIKNILSLVEYILTVIYFTSNAPNELFYSVFSYITIVRWSTVTYLYFLAMIFVTGDRLIATLIDMKYRAVCTVGRTKILIGFSWCFCWFVTFPMVTYVYFFYGMLTLGKKGIADVLVVYVQCAFASAYLLYTMLSYLIIFKKHCYNVNYRHSKSSDVQSFIFVSYR